MDLRELPEHLIVVGGGFIGCEVAQMFRRFGANVTVVQRADRLLPAEDPDISAAVTQGFDADGINVITSTSCTYLTGTADHLRTQVAHKALDKPTPVCSSHTPDDIDANNGTSTIKADVKTAVADGFCACEHLNPSEKCCLAGIHRTITTTSTVAVTA